MIRNKDKHKGANLQKNKMQKTIQGKVLILILVVSVPVYIVMLFLSDLLFHDMEIRLIEEKEKSLNFFCSQIETKMEDSVSYVYKILGKGRWGGLLDREGSKNYELAKMDLWLEISDMLEFFPYVDGFYIRISSTNEVFMCYKIEQITIKDYEKMKTWIKSVEVSNQWSIQRINENDYFNYCVGNGYFDMGILVNVQNIYREWKNLEENEIIFTEYELNEEKKELTLSRNFLNKNIKIVNYVPYHEIRSYMPIQYYLMLMFPIIGIVICIVALVVLKKILNTPLKHIKNAIMEINEGNIDYRIVEFDSSVEFADIEQSFNKMLDQIYNLKILAYDLQLESQKTQYLNLRLQINPHFLLNSLNTIYALTQLKKFEDIKSFVYDLVCYFQYVLHNSNEVVCLKKEIEFVEHFVSIQNVRFPDSFYVVYDVEETLYEEMIPPLMIENFVENSIKHALKKKEMIEILVIVKKREDFLVLSICDNGKGMKKELLEKIRNAEQIEDEKGKHIGIWNCIRRLKLLYQDRAEISITSEEGEGTQIWMKIPCWKMED